MPSLIRWLELDIMNVDKSSPPLFIEKEWPLFEGNPKSHVLHRRRNNARKNIGRYQLHIKMIDSIIRRWGPFESSNAKILEVGCGTGMTVLEFANKGYDVTGLEIDHNLCLMINALANQYSINSNCIPGDACSMPFSKNAFDVVYSKSFFEHVYDVDQALSEQKRVLKNGGLLIIEDGNIWNIKLLIDLLFLYPIRTKGKHGGIKWFLHRNRVFDNLYGYLPKGCDENVKSVRWWREMIQKDCSLKSLEITTTSSYTRQGIPSFLRNFSGGCLVIARKEPG